MSNKHLENEHLMQEKQILPPSSWVKNHPSKPYLSSFDEYKKLYKESIENPEKFFGEQARKELSWFTDFTTTKYSPNTDADTQATWFLEGEINACYNAVDRHAIANPNKPAIIYEADEPGEGQIITYGELLAKVSQLSQVLINLGVKKGDAVCVYLPMIPEALITLLAIVRIGAVHSVVFAGFSSGALRDRINNASSKVVITADESKRGGKIIETKKIVDEALKEAPQVTNVLLVKRTGNKHVPINPKKDLWYHEEVAKYSKYFPCVPVNSEDPLFLLYTSGSTGKPKGIQHSTAGYLLNALLTTKYTFDVHPEDIFFTAGDIGWITGHSYVVYGPLLNGSTTVVFEGTPAYPDFSRYWQIVEKYKVNQFYVAPTALRLLKKAGDKFIEGHDLSSLRSLGSVGEPIAAEIWEWYNEKIGQGRCTIQDTYWQTETGSHIITPLAGITPMKPGSASLPFFGIDVAILDPSNGHELKGNNVEGVLAIKLSWPSVARTIYGDYERFEQTYYKPYPGYFFTGDGGARDKDGFYWVLGRVDDVVNVSGHRLSTAEIEASIIENHVVAENAVVGYAHELTGQAIAAFVALKNKDGIDVEEAKKEIIMDVRKEIGPFAAPKLVFIVNDLPKTRSGKIMRRILRKILAGEEDQLGDVSTLSNPQVVENLISVVANSKK